MIHLYEVRKEVKPLNGNGNQNSDHDWSGVGGLGSSGKGHKGALWGEGNVLHVWVLQWMSQLIQLNVYGLWIFLYINYASTTYLLNTFLKVMVNFVFFALSQLRLLVFIKAVIFCCDVNILIIYQGFITYGPMIAFNGSLNPVKLSAQFCISVCMYFSFPLKVHSYHRILKRVHDPKMYLKQNLCVNGSCRMCREWYQ